MIRGTVRNSLILTACATALIGCGSSDGGSMPGPDANDSQRQSLLYAYPDNGQTEVPSKAPVVLRFTSDISLGDAEQSITLCCDDEGADLAFTAETVGPDPRGVMLTPAQPLSPLTQYTVDIRNLRLSNGTAADRTIQFTTRPLQDGPKSLVVKDDGFAIDRQAPSGDSNEPIMDFSTFRFQFTQPIDRASARYGDTVMLTSGGQPLEATLLISGHYMTVDPKEEYLTPGQSYTLEITNGLASTFGEAFAGTSVAFTPKDSSPRGEPALLVQRITQDGFSRLTGKGINQVPVNGTLLGEDVNVTQASADAVVAELADVTEYPDVTPIRLARGTQLKGSAIEMVMIGGAVPAGFGSGAVDMRLTSDATGYLVPNPYNSQRADALRIVHLLMDVGIATADARANGGFTQDIMHIELVGVAEVDTEEGVLNLDAVGMVEPNILGQEIGYGLLSFQLQSYQDQLNAPTAPKDTTGPTLQSWTADDKSPEMPMDESGDALSWFQHPGTSIVLNFDEPLDQESLRKPGALTVTRNGATLDFTHKVDGAAVVIQPEGGLRYSEAENNPEYQIQLGSQIADLAGNNFVPETLTFKLPGKVTTRSIPDRDGDYSEEDVQVNSPMLLSAYPGYPCVTDPTTRDLANGLVGRCAGGPGDWPNEDYPLIDYHPDDLLPLMSLPANRPIVLQFTKTIDPASVVLGGSFDIFRVDESGQPIDGETIQGSLNVEGQRITFVPDEPWADGEYYNYILGSNNDMDLADGISSQFTMIGSADAVCDGTESICGEEGYPLRTQPLGITYREPFTPDDADGTFRVVANYLINNEYFIPNGGGPDLAIFFKGEPANEDVLQTLRTSPDVDVNGNLIHDSENTIGKLTSVVNADPPFYRTDPAVNSRAPLPDGTLPTTDYPLQEASPSVPDPDADPVYDPEGVQGLPNSAKVLSTNTRGRETPWFAEGTNFGSNPFVAVQAVALYSVDGANVGCGYDEAYDPVTGEPGYTETARDINILLGNLLAGQYPEYEPTVCPENKFTYLKMGLNASVGRYDPENEAIKVEIYPSQVTSTSFVTYARNAVAGLAATALPSGEQIMRMRYAKDDPSCVETPSTTCRRTQPITGWIKEGDDGNPILTADVDLYIDAPFIGAVLNASTLSLRHNLRSYKANMSLSGPVSFLDDGRMVVEQRNENSLNIDLEMYSARASGGSGSTPGIAIGRIPYKIPENGVFLQMASEPIKLVE